jgi:hypothetical protein
MNYRIIWEIDVDADTAREAAQKAWMVQHNPRSLATAFTVFDELGRKTQVDLTDDE